MRVRTLEVRIASREAGVVPILLTREQQRRVVRKQRPLDEADGRLLARLQFAEFDVGVAKFGA